MSVNTCVLNTESEFIKSFPTLVTWPDEHNMDRPIGLERKAISRGMLYSRTLDTLIERCLVLNSKLPATLHIIVAPRICVGVEPIEWTPPTTVMWERMQ